MSLRIWIIAIGLMSSPAWACDIPQVATKEDAVTQFDQLRRAQCLGDVQCTTDECKVVSALEKEPSPERVLIVLRRLNDKALELNETRLGVTQLHGMLKRWNMPTPPEIQTSATLEWQGRAFNLFMHTPYALNLESEFEQCENAAACFDSAVTVYTLSSLIHRTLSTVTADKIAAVGVMLNTLNDRWSAFHTKSRAVFPWELVVNNFAYRSAEKGFSGPPNYQWLFLHPSVALAYDSDQEDKLQEAILLDLVGRYQWRWGGKNDAEIVSPYGAALAMSWTGDDPGYGFAVHLPQNWSVGLTRSKGDSYQLLVSVEFAQYVTDKAKNVDTIRERLEALRQPQ